MKDHQSPKRLNELKLWKLIEIVLISTETNFRNFNLIIKNLRSCKLKKVFSSLSIISVTLVLIVATLVGCKKAGTSDNLDWETNLEIALQKAQKENKAVLVNFTGSDWCIWCQRLSNEVFSQSEFEKFAKENLVLVKIDFPKNIELPIETRMYNNQLAQRFGVEGFPTIFLLKPDGNVILQTGYQPGGPVNYINHLKSYM